MIRIIDELNHTSHPITDVRHLNPTGNRETVQTISGAVRTLNPNDYAGTVTVFTGESGKLTVKVDCEDSVTENRIKKVLSISYQIAS